VPAAQPIASGPQKYCRGLANVAGPVLVIATINLALAIITEATLSFLERGLPPTQRSIGAPIQIGQKHLFAVGAGSQPFLGIALSALVLAVTCAAADCATREARSCVERDPEKWKLVSRLREACHCLSRRSMLRRA
jgi:hypothetical protein